MNFGGHFQTIATILPWTLVGTVSSWMRKIFLMSQGSVTFKEFPLDVTQEK
jgi:hypothetical protein